MLLLLLAILGDRWGIWEQGVIAWAAILPMPGMYLAMLRFYKQGKLKTFVKWCLYSFLYVFAFAISFVLGLIVVFALF